MRLQDECRYTKHIYIGSQRVVSKIGDFDSYGSDPRRIQYAGSETDGLSVVNSYNMIAEHRLFYTLHEFTTLRTFILLIYQINRQGMYFILYLMSVFGFFLYCHKSTVQMLYH